MSVQFIQPVYQHFCYSLLCAGDGFAYLKIGITAKPTERLQSIMQGVPFIPKYFSVCTHPSKKSARRMEFMLLARCSDWSARGEWLRIPYEDSAKFRAIKKAVTEECSNSSVKLAWAVIKLSEYRETMRQKQVTSFANYKHRLEKYGPAYRDYMRHVG